MIVCKVCGNQNEAGAQFCGSCGSFLEWTGESTEDTTIVQPPRPIPTVDPGPVPLPGPLPQPEPVPPGSVICRNCGTANEPSRVYCRSCATELAAAMPPGGLESGLPPMAPNQSGGGSRLSPVALLAIGVVGILVVGAAGIFVLGGGPGSTTPPSSLGPTTAASPTASPSVTPDPSASGESPSPSVVESPTPEPGPDEQILVMIDVAGSAPDRIGIMDGDGSGGLTTIVTGAVTSPAWRPGHAQIVFVRDGGLVIANPDGSDEEELTPPGSSDDNPEWSPDGNWIAFDRGPQFREDIFKIRPDGSDLTNLSDRNGEDRGPTWSPDSDQIAYVSTRANSNREIFVMTADGDDQTNVTKNAARDVDPAWSPDGTQILFASDRDEDTLYLWFMDVESLEVERAVEPGPEPDHDGQWSPDGTRIVFHRGTGGLFVVIADVDGNEIKAVRPKSPIRLPAWK